MFWGCSGGVLGMFRRCLGGVWEVFGMVWGCWEVFGRCLGVFGCCLVWVLGDTYAQHLLIGVGKQTNKLARGGQGSIWTPPKHLPHTSQTPFKHLPNSSQTPPKHPSNTAQTPLKPVDPDARSVPNRTAQPISTGLAPIPLLPAPKQLLNEPKRFVLARLGGVWGAGGGGSVPCQ